MREVKADQLRQELRWLLDEIDHDGEHVTVMRYDTPLAVMVPVAWYEKAKAAIERAHPDGTVRVTTDVEP